MVGLVASGSTGHEINLLKRWLVGLFHNENIDPTSLPSPLTRADARWLREGEGCKTSAFLIKTHGASAKAVMKKIQTGVHPLRRSEVAHFRGRLRRMVRAGIYMETRGQGREILYYVNPLLTILQCLSQDCMLKIWKELKIQQAENEKELEKIRQLEKGLKKEEKRCIHNRKEITRLQKEMRELVL